jgi:hypothetical protein
MHGRIAVVSGMMALGAALGWPGAGVAQLIGPAQGHGLGLGMASGTYSGALVLGMPGFGSASPTINTNPYMNPYLNPFLNPYIIPQSSTMSGRNAALFFLAAQQARAGMGMSPNGLANHGSPSGGLANRGQTNGAAARLPERSSGRPVSAAASNGPSGWYNDNPTVDDRSGRLARYFAAYGPYGGGGAGSPDRRLGQDQGLGKYFNRYPKRDPGNTR